MSDSYDPPQDLLDLGDFLSTLRSQYSTDFAFFLAHRDQDGFSSYQDGLMRMAYILLGIFVLWLLLLLVMKLSGKFTGCAAGKAFEQQRKHDPLTTGQGSNDSTQLYGPKSDEHDEQPHWSNRDSRSLGSSIESESYEEQEVEMERSHVDDHSSVDSDATVTSPREWRTRVVFFLFGFVILACIPLFFKFSYHGVSDTTASYSIYIDDASSTVDKVQTNVNIIKGAQAFMFDILLTQELTFALVCPDVDESTATSRLGVDLSSMINLYSDHYLATMEDASSHVSELERLSHAVSGGLQDIEEANDTTSRYLFLMPLLLVTMGSITVTLIAGAVLAWKKQSSQQIQKFLAWVVLPLHILATICCWLVMIGAALSTSVAYDACTQGSEQGSFASTVRDIMSYQDFVPDNFSYRFVNAFISGCRGDDPIQEMIGLESDIQGAVNETLGYLTQINLGDRDGIVAQCGGDSIESFLYQSEDVAGNLELLQRALANATEVLGCEPLEHLYNVALNESTCNTLASSSVWSFVLFLTICVSGMILVTLRSALWAPIKEDKIFDDLDEEAENMILDEHEEYLEYISKYKQEWQEYGGIERGVAHESPAEFSDSLPEPMNHPNVAIIGVTAETAGYAKDLAGYEPSDVESSDYPTDADTFDPYNVTGTNLSRNSSVEEDISFHSLRHQMEAKPTAMLPRDAVIDEDDFVKGTDTDFSPRLFPKVLHSSPSTPRDQGVEVSAPTRGARSYTLFSFGRK